MAAKDENKEEKKVRKSLSEWVLIVKLLLVSQNQVVKWSDCIGIGKVVQ